MNRTNFEHAGYALIMQLAVYVIFGDMLAGGMFGFAFFLGREHAQFERKLPKDVNSLSPFDGFKIWKWSTDSKLDLLFPFIVNLAIWLIYVEVFK